MESLTKENFWDSIEQKYPVAFTRFSVWIDEYKKRVNWDSLFRVHETMYNGRVVCIGVSPKFHSLPIEMQMGIIISFFLDTQQIYYHSTVDVTSDNFVKEIEDNFRILNKQDL